MTQIKESFKSNKLKSFAKQHGGLKNGKWSAGFENDLYNMTDDDFDNYTIVDQGEHYRRYGINGWDKNSNYTNNNFQPIEFNDGTFMVKKNPEYKWDERAKNMIKIGHERSENKQNDGTKEYQYENPYLNGLINSIPNDFKPRGDWGFKGDEKLTKNQLNPRALKQKHKLGTKGKEVTIVDKAKASDKKRQKVTINESQLKKIVYESVKKIMKENYDYDLDYESIYEQAMHYLMTNRIKNQSWRRIAQELGFRLETIGRYDIETLKDAIEDAMADSI